MWSKCAFEWLIVWLISVVCRQVDRCRNRSIRATLWRRRARWQTRCEPEKRLTTAASARRWTRLVLSPHWRYECGPSVVQAEQSVRCSSLCVRAITFRTLKNCPRSRIEVRPTALLRYHAHTRWLDIDLWPWPVTLTFNLRRAMVMTRGLHRRNDGLLHCWMREQPSLITPQRVD